jgi:ribosomal protein S18 acetylase RimI-like enzyme
MFDLQNECEFIPLSPNTLLVDFDCGDADINDFFNIDAIKYQEQMLGQTYFFRHKATSRAVCAFSLSPDSLNTATLPNNRRRKVKENIPHQKPLKSYPAYLIGRFGVASTFSGQNIGSQLLNFIKYFCLNNYGNSCRFLVVDAYNNPAVLNFYRKNDFLTVFSTEEQEREYKKLDISTTLQTRYMFFDMIYWKNKMSVS